MVGAFDEMVTSMNEWVGKVANASPEVVDVVLDELNDEICSASIGEEDAAALVRGLSGVVGPRGASAAQESFLNVLSTLYLQGRALGDIERVVLDRLEGLQVNSLSHALEIIGASHLPKRVDILSEYERHASLHIRALAQKLLRGR